MFQMYPNESVQLDRPLRSKVCAKIILISEILGQRTCTLYIIPGKRFIAFQQYEYINLIVKKKKKKRNRNKPESDMSNIILSASTQLRFTVSHCAGTYCIRTSLPFFIECCDFIVVDNVQRHEPLSM